MDEPLVDEKGQDSGAGQKKKARAILILAVVLGVVYAYNVFFSSPPGDQVTEKTAGGETPTGPGRDSETAGEAPTSGAIDIEKDGERAYVLEFDKRLAQQTQTIERIAEETKKTQARLEERLSEMQNDLDKKIGILVEEQTTAEDDRQRNIRYGPGGLPVPGDQISGPVGGERKAAPSQIEYVSFGRSQTGDAGKPFQPIKDAKETIDGGLKTPETKPIGSQARQEQERREKEARRKIDVPAGAYANVTLLHAVDCPVGDKLAVPVVLPVMSSIRGPNGDIVDLGHAHLLGKCVGLANTERGRISVERISYVGADGKQQNVKVTGYIVDRRDSGQDVAGYYESKEGEALAKAALANAIAAMGKLSILTESTTGVSTMTGAATSTLTGDVGKAAVGAALGGAAERTSQYYQSQLERLIPIVHVEPALPLNFVSTDPFEVDDPSQDYVNENL